MAAGRGVRLGFVFEGRGSVCYEEYPLLTRPSATSKEETLCDEHPVDETFDQGEAASASMQLVCRFAASEVTGGEGLNVPLRPF